MPGARVAGHYGLVSGTVDGRNIYNCETSWGRHTCQHREKFSRDKLRLWKGGPGSSPGNFQKPVVQMVQSELFLSYICQYN